MMNRPGYSWGPDHPVNAMRTSKGWLLIDFSGERPRTVARYPKRLGVFCFIEAMNAGARLNYGSEYPDGCICVAMDDEA